MQPTRRPLRSRDSRWAAAIAGGLVRLGIRPNAISVASVVFAAAAGGALWFAGRSAPGYLPWLFVAAALLIQVRLLCNLFDGMVAIEGGAKTKSGEVFNELPDRFADALILIGAGYSWPASDWMPLLGWLCGPGYPHCVCAGHGRCGWCVPAFLRAHGEASSHGRNDRGVCRLRNPGVVAFRFLPDALGAVGHCGGLYRDRLPSNRPHYPGFGSAMIELVAFLFRTLCGARASWRGCEPAERQRIYFANHSSHLDAVVLWAALPSRFRARTRPVAARDYWAASRIRLWLAEKIFRAVLIERRTVTTQENPLRDMLAVLDAGDSLILFPEGTRNAGGEPQKFKSGLFHLARQRPDIELVPVYLENLNRILPKGEMVPVPLLGSVTLGQPVRLETAETKESFLERARRAVWDLHCA